MNQPKNKEEKGCCKKCGSKGVTGVTCLDTSCPCHSPVLEEEKKCKNCGANRGYSHPQDTYFKDICTKCGNPFESTQEPMEWESEFIKKVANNFLGWKLPDDFHPDCGISYTQIGINNTPVGTNLFTAVQAEEMVKHILGNELSSQIKQAEERERERIIKEIEELYPEYRDCQSDKEKAVNSIIITELMKTVQIVKNLITNQ